MSDGIIIAFISVVGAILGALITGLTTIVASSVKSKSEGKGESQNQGSISCAIIGLVASIGGIGGLVLGGFFGVFLFQKAVGTLPTESPTQAPTQLSSPIPVNPTVSSSVQQPTLQVISPTNQPPTQQIISPTQISKTIPQSASEAANLFGGPPANNWQACPQENNCWMFSLPNNSFQISVPEYCLNANGSIDGWRYHGGYPEQPDSIEGTIRIWNSLEAAVIRCR